MNAPEEFRRSTGSQRSGPRGRIAEVLAQARASLTEPSRPFTPMSLDSRVAAIASSQPLPQLASMGYPVLGKKAPKQFLSEVYDLTTGEHTSTIGYSFIHM